MKRETVTCVRCHRPAFTTLDGDKLCRLHADEWVRSLEPIPYRYLDEWALAERARIAESLDRCDLPDPSALAAYIKRHLISPSGFCYV